MGSLHVALSKTQLDRVSLFPFLESHHGQGKEDSAEEVKNAPTCSPISYPFIKESLGVRLLLRPELMLDKWSVDR